ncbi:16S rRNA (uracil(1498)-N(3))-methyltransferase [Jatrophihabitans telluris]|uniref:Ribosomal RNA small subunit methyltransferase E n=1 Tax=Jatrophihabitans telluris TaxID=2038343 RepID=A0ABY4QW61_9ACTN|nr:16S rRNA (uracil(1498)-N(3))-methyltransferase [Jatrophihabitans telluris]UQX87497.1 16S rRNA (uracil(1498)-N(3))-methyltransferase [Jatrophihabitans telluris]
MTPPLFLLDDLSAAKVGGQLVLTGSEARHAVTVKRLAVAEEVLLSDGRGRRVRAVVATIERGGSARGGGDGDRVGLTVLSVEDVRGADPRFVVVQALPKGERAELAVEVLTELGVDEIVPWSASRSISQWRAGEKVDKGVAKWRRTAAEAAKQSRRSTLPEVAGLRSTTEVCQLIRQAELSLVLHEDAADALTATVLPPTGSVVIVVGPEGGIAEDELASFTAAGARAVRLGTEVMRTSTAGAAALSVLSALTGRWA